MKLNTRAVYSLNEAIIKLHDAARQAEQDSPKVAGDIGELAEEVQAIKDWGEEKQK